MPLRLHGVWDSWGIVFDPIPFFCTDGRKKIRCWASLDALAKVAGRRSLDALDDTELADLFSRWVEWFAERASEKFDRGLFQPDGSICVTPADVTAPQREAPSMPRKMGAAGR